MKAFVMRVDTAQTITQWCWGSPTNRSGNKSLKTRKRSQTSQTADHVVVKYSDEEPEHLPRTNDHEAVQAEWWRWRCMRQTSKQ